jgi:hypothetical protein
MVDVAHLYDLAGIHFAQGDFVWKTTTATFYMALYTSALTPAQTTDEVYSNTEELASANGYTQGGNPITIVADPSLVGSDPNVYTKLTSSDVTWTGATFTGVRTAIIYKNTGTKYLVGFITWTSDKAAQGGLFTVAAPATGWFNLATP